MTFKDKGYYFGYFKDGKRNGEGLFMHANKDRYSGLWKNGLKHGEGTFIIDATQVKLVGQWFEGRILKGKWEMNDGSVYQGEFQHNKPNGEGTWQLSNGNVVAGRYT
jgi:radial spoke head protein 1